MRLEICGRAARLGTAAPAGMKCPCAHGGWQVAQCQRVISPDKLRQDASLALTLQRTESIQVTVVGTTAQGDEGEATIQVLGRRFGHFELIEPLGQGGMGQVFRALDHSLQRFVAVKILRRGKNQNDERQIELLLQEAIAQARVNHPNVATIYYVGREGGDPFLAMEFLDGGTLAEKIKAGPLSYPEIASIAVQIVNALRVSHRYDIIHGDIKPTNLLIKGTGEVKLSDFGMARSAFGERLGIGIRRYPQLLCAGIIEWRTSLDPIRYVCPGSHVIRVDVRAVAGGAVRFLDPAMAGQSSDRKACFSRAVARTHSAWLARFISSLVELGSGPAIRGLRRGHGGACRRSSRFARRRPDVFPA